MDSAVCSTTRSSHRMDAASANCSPANWPENSQASGQQAQQRRGGAGVVVGSGAKYGQVGRAGGGAFHLKRYRLRARKRTVEGLVQQLGGLVETAVQGQLGVFFPQALGQHLVGQVVELAGAQFVGQQVGQHGFGGLARLLVGKGHLAHLLQLGFGQGLGVVEVHFYQQGPVVRVLPGIGKLGESSKREALDGEGGLGG
jgi:hypothetical protein